MRPQARVHVWQEYVGMNVMCGVSRCMCVHACQCMHIHVYVCIVYTWMLV